MNGINGIMSLPEGCSLGAWEHEWKHACDDIESGFMGRLAFASYDEMVKWEKRAYHEEKMVARRIGDKEIEKEIVELEKKSRQDIWNAFFGRRARG
ncbi:MAG: hypothetical protein SOI38_05015 [Eggerthellaceae bacterium]|jgi:hypothetical protein